MYIITVENNPYHPYQRVSKSMSLSVNVITVPSYMSSDVNTAGAQHTPIMRIKGEDEILSEILYLIIIVVIIATFYVQSRLKALTFHMAAYPQKADQYLFFQVCRVHNWGTSR